MMQSIARLTFCGQTIQKCSGQTEKKSPEGVLNAYWQAKVDELKARVEAAPGTLPDAKVLLPEEAEKLTRMNATQQYLRESRFNNDPLVRQSLQMLTDIIEGMKRKLLG